MFKKFNLFIVVLIVLIDWMIIYIFGVVIVFFSIVA